MQYKLYIYIDGRREFYGWAYDEVDLKELKDDAIRLYGWLYPSFEWCKA